MTTLQSYEAAAIHFHNATLSPLPPHFGDAQGPNRAYVSPEVPSLDPVAKRTLAARRDAPSSKRGEQATIGGE